MNKSRKLYNYIANIKTVALLAVVFWHCSLFFEENPYFPESSGIVADPVTFLGSIHNVTIISAYVFCSGFLFALSLEQRNRSVGQLILNRAMRLLVPYYLFGALWLVPLYTIFDINAFGRPPKAGFWEGMKCMLLGQFSDHLWFLWMLFWVTLFFCLLSPLLKKQKYVTVGILTIAAAFCTDLFLADFPYFKLSQTASYYICFFIGILCFRFKDKIEGKSAAVYWLLTAVLLGVLILYAAFLPSHFTVMYIIRPIGAFCYLFLFLALDKNRLWNWVENTHTYRFLEARGMDMYLMNMPFPYLYYRVFADIGKVSIGSCIEIVFAHSMIAIAVFVQLKFLLRGLLLRSWKMVVSENKKG